MGVLRVRLMFLLLIMYSQAVWSQTLIDVEVYGLHQQVTRQIKNNDTLFTGDSFQISIKSSKKQNIFAFIKDTKGVFSRLDSDKKDSYVISSGEVFHYPGRDHWFRLDRATGVETLYFISGDVDQCSQEVVNNLTDESVRVVTERGVCQVKTIAINHINNDFSILSKQTTRGVQNVEFDDTDELLKRFEANYQRYDDKDTSMFIDVAKSLPNHALSNKPESVRGIKEVHLFKEISPSVVLIATEDGIGTGSVINREGDVVTNWHVVDGYEKVAVVFKPATRRSLQKSDLLVADVIRVDEVSDLALIRVREMPGNIKPIEFGDSGEIDVGEDVHAIGHPNGNEWSYTRGYISSLRYDYEWKYDSRKQHKASLVIQTQTPINPGNSGGPLLSSDGKLIGVNSFIAKGEGLNYAVSINDVSQFMKRTDNRKAELIQTEEDVLSEELGFKVISIRELDVNEDGVIDHAVDIDANENGVIDNVILRDGSTGRVFFIEDSDENGVPEKMYYDTDGNGEIDEALLDSDGDGEFDIIAKDKDEDGEYDSYTPIK